MTITLALYLSVEDQASTIRYETSDQAASQQFSFKMNSEELQDYKVLKRTGTLRLYRVDMYGSIKVMT